MQRVELTQIDGPRTDVSDITTYEYYDNTPGQGNNRGQLKTITNALGQSTQLSGYDANGNVGSVTDPNGVTTQYTYDGRSRIATISNVSTGALTQYAYDSHGNLASIIPPEGNRIDFMYNLADRVTQIRDNLGNKVQYQYDVEGNRITEDKVDSQGTLKKQLDFTYDAYNRLARIVNPDASYTEYTYDDKGNRTAIRDPKNKITSLTYDALDRTKTITQPLNTITDQGFDTHDNLTSVTDPIGNVTQYQVDDFGRKNVTTSPDTGTTRYLYDETGNVVQQIDAKGIVVNYTYDALNRPTTIQFPSDTTQNITFTYDSTSVTYGIGKLTGRTDPSGTYTFYYDAQGNMNKEQKTIDNVLYTTQYTYNRNNALTSITYPTGRVVTYTRDQAGNISQVDTTLNGNPKTLVSAVTYLPFGGITGLIYGNNLSLSQGYDNQYRVSSITVGSLLGLTYAYDANGNIASITDTLNPRGTAPPETSATYTYDQYSNKLLHVAGTPSEDFGYDANGNTTSENTRTYVYDLSNQLVKVLDGGSQIAAYTFNGAGQRIKKVTTETRIFHYDPQGHLIAETNGTGQVLAEYVYLNDRRLALIKPRETVYYHHNNHLGTPQVLTDGTANVAWKATYTLFGQAQILVQAVVNPFRLPGQYYDTETGLNYNYHRTYHPNIGRYVTPDPIGLSGGMNLYVYAENNPVGLIDPVGLSSLTFDRQSGTVTAYTSNGTVVGSYPAGNNAQSGSRGAWAPGTYDYAYHTTHKDDSPDSAYGTYGNFVFAVKGCSGCGIHAGQENVPDKRKRTGPQHATSGCIRTTDEGTKTIGEMHFLDPLKTITVK